MNELNITKEPGQYRVVVDGLCLCILDNEQFNIIKELVLYIEPKPVGLSVTRFLNNIGENNGTKFE